MTPEQEEKDLEYARSMYLELIEDSKEAIQLMKELTIESGHPRSAEVLATTIKTASDITDRLIELHKSQKQMRSVKESNKEIANNTTNNNLFLTTADLQKMMTEVSEVKAIDGVLGSVDNDE
jgi:hypothetical protein